MANNDEFVSTTRTLYDNASEWSLADDIRLLDSLKLFSNRLINNAEAIVTKLDHLHHDLDEFGINVEFAHTNFHGLRNSQFMEFRVQDDNEEELSTTSTQIGSSTNDENQTNIDDLVKDGLDFMDKYFDTVKVELSDDDDDEESDNNEDITSGYMLRLKDTYIPSSLPLIIGTEEWHQSLKSPSISSASESEDESNQNSLENHISTDSSVKSDFLPIHPKEPLPPTTQIHEIEANFATQLSARLDQIQRSNPIENINREPIRKTSETRLFDDEPPPMHNTNVDNNITKSKNEPKVRNSNLFDDDDDFSDNDEIDFKNDLYSTSTNENTDFLFKSSIRNENRIFPDQPPSLDQDSVKNPTKLGQTVKSSTNKNHTKIFSGQQQSNSNVENIQNPITKNSTNFNQKTANSLFNDEDLFTFENDKRKKFTSSLFDDIDDEDDDLFKNLKTKKSNENQEGIISTGQIPNTSTASNLFENVPKKKISIFDDDSSDDDSSIFHTSKSTNFDRTLMPESRTKPNTDTTIVNPKNYSPPDHNKLSTNSPQTTLNINVPISIAKIDTKKSSYTTSTNSTSNTHIISSKMGIGSSRNRNNVENENNNTSSTICCLTSNPNDECAKIEKSTNQSEIFDDSTTEDNVQLFRSQNKVPYQLDEEKDTNNGKKHFYKGKDNTQNEPKTKAKNLPGKLKTALNINVNALLPNAVRPKLSKASDISPKKADHTNDDDDEDELFKSARSTLELSQADISTTEIQQISENQISNCNISKSEESKKDDLDDRSNSKTSSVSDKETFGFDTGNVEILPSITKNRAQLPQNRRSLNRKSRLFLLAQSDREFSLENANEENSKENSHQENVIEEIRSTNDKLIDNQEISKKKIPKETLSLFDDDDDDESEVVQIRSKKSSIIENVEEIQSKSILFENQDLSPVEDDDKQLVTNDSSSINPNQNISVYENEIEVDKNIDTGLNKNVESSSTKVQRKKSIFNDDNDDDDDLFKTNPSLLKLEEDRKINDDESLTKTVFNSSLSIEFGTEKKRIFSDDDDDDDDSEDFFTKKMSTSKYRNVKKSSLFDDLDDDDDDDNDNRDLFKSTVSTNSTKPNKKSDSKVDKLKKIQSIDDDPLSKFFD